MNNLVHAAKTTVTGEIHEFVNWADWKQDGGWIVVEKKDLMYIN
jgi:hypothetical protein